MISPSTATVLIVDDSSTMRTILRDMLVRLGYRSIDEAENGKAAIEKIGNTAYAVIISDLYMEPVDGMELLRRVRQKSRAGTNRFIFTTTERSWGSKTSAKLDGAAAFITKPFTIDTLKTTLDAVLRT